MAAASAAGTSSTSSHENHRPAGERSPGSGAGGTSGLNEPASGGGLSEMAGRFEGATTACSETPGFGVRDIRSLHDRGFKPSRPGGQERQHTRSPPSL